MKRKDFLSKVGKTSIGIGILSLVRSTNVEGGVNDNSSLNKIVGNTDISNVANTLTEAVGNEALQTKSKTLSGAINETKQGLGTQCTFH